MQEYSIRFRATPKPHHRSHGPCGIPLFAPPPCPFAIGVYRSLSSAPPVFFDIGCCPSTSLRNLLRMVARQLAPMRSLGMASLRVVFEETCEKVVSGKPPKHAATSAWPKRLGLGHLHCLMLRLLPPVAQRGFTGIVRESFATRCCLSCWLSSTDKLRSISCLCRTRLISRRRRHVKAACARRPAVALHPS